MFLSKWEKNNKKQMPISTKTIRVLVKKAAIEAFKNAGKRLKGERFHPHLFRHHFATHWYQKGLEDDTLRRMMGHERFKTTMRVYIHVNPM